MLKAPSKSTVSYQNKNRSWELFRDYYYVLLESLGQQAQMKRTKFKIKSKIFLLNATTISLCLSLFDWAKSKESMDTKLTQRLEEQLNEIKQKLSKKGTLKKISKIHKKVGAIKSKLSRIGWLYDIQYVEDHKKNIVIDIN